MRLCASNHTQNRQAIQEVRYLNYYNPRLNIGLDTWREVYQLQPLKRLYPEVYRGKLVYRAKGSHKRVSYEQLKRDLIKKLLRVVEDVSDWFGKPRPLHLLFNNYFQAQRIKTFRCITLALSWGCPDLVLTPI